MRVLKTDRSRLLLSAILFAIAWWVLASLFPYSGDDWAWGIYPRFFTLNGRYAANALAMLLTQAEWLKAPLMAFFMTVMVWGAAKAGSFERTPKFLFTAVLFLFVTVDIFRQNFVWSSGFATYTVPVALLFLIIYIYISNGQINKTVKWLLGALCVILAYILQLFTENVTLYCVAMSLILLFAEWRRRRQQKPWNPLIIPIVIAVLAGAVTMFTNGAYWGVGTAGTHPMPLFSEIFYNVKMNYGTLVVPYFTINLVLNALITVLLLIALLKTMPSLSKKKTNLAHIVCWVLVLCNIYLFVRRVHPVMPHPLFFKYLDGLAAFLFLLSLSAGVLLLAPGKHRSMMLFSLASFVIVCAPLLPVVPIGARCFFIMYAFLALFANACLHLLLENGWLKIKLSVAAPIVAGTFLCLLCTYLLIYRQIDNADSQRLASARLQAAAGQKTLVLRRLPFPNYVWIPDPTEYYTYDFITMNRLQPGSRISLVP